MGLVMLQHPGPWWELHHSLWEGWPTRRPGEGKRSSFQPPPPSRLIRQPLPRPRPGPPPTSLDPGFQPGTRGRALGPSPALLMWGPCPHQACLWPKGCLFQALPHIWQGTGDMALRGPLANHTTDGSDGVAALEGFGP